MLSNIKQAELSKLTGISKGAISNYVAGRYEPKSDAIRKLAAVLNVSEMWLWGYDVPAERSITKEKCANSLTPHENTVITAYREQPAVQPTVDRLLGVSQNAEVIPLSHIIRIAGRDGSLEERKLTDEQIDLIRRMIQQMPDFED